MFFAFRTTLRSHPLTFHFWLFFLTLVLFLPSISAAAVPHRMLSAESVNFEQVGGSLTQISVGADGSVWGVNSSQQVFRFDGNGWAILPGTLRQVAVGSNTAVWGINAQQQTFRWNSVNMAWDYVPGTLSEIAVGADGDAWGVNAQAAVFHYDGKSRGWNRIDGSLTQIAVGSAGAVYGVNSGGSAFWYNPGTGSFRAIPGSALFTQISAGVDGDAWAIAAGVAYHYDVLHDRMKATSGDVAQVTVGYGGAVFGLSSSGQPVQWSASSNTWIKLSGTLSSIIAGANGAVWGLNNQHAVFQLAGEPTRPFQTQIVAAVIPPAIDPYLTSVQLSVGVDGNVWAVITASTFEPGPTQPSMYTVEFFNTGTQSFEPVVGAPPLTQLSVAWGANVWGVDASGVIYRYEPSSGSWKTVPGWLSSVWVAANGSVWGENLYRQTFTYDASTATWDNIPGALSDLSLAADGTIWGQGLAPYRFDSSTRSWVLSPATGLSDPLTDISVGGASNIWGANGGLQIFQYSSESQAWSAVPASPLPATFLYEVWATFDGSAFASDYEGHVYQVNQDTQTLNTIMEDGGSVTAGNAVAVWATVNTKSGPTGGSVPINYWF